MARLLPVVLVVVAMVSVVVYLRFFRGEGLPPGPQTETVQALPTPVPLPEIQTGQQPAGTPKPTASPVINPGGSALSNLSAIEARVKSLESAVTSLQTQLNQQNQTTQTTTTQTASKKSPVYIPLGSGGQWNDQNWFALTSYEASIDPAEYEGYLSMQLEVNMRLVQAAGKAYARLYNVTDGSEIASSEVSTESDKSVLLTSTSFKLPAGRKTYRLQVKSTYGFNIELQTARIKVSF